MKKALTSFLAFVLSFAPVLAATPVDLIIDSAGNIQIDEQNPRVITGCWDSDNQAVMFYRNADRTIFANEICDMPNRESRGLGLTTTARALNYSDFLDKTLGELTDKTTDTVLGSLGGYDYAWLKAFLKLDGACEKFDVLAFHPFHFGVAPDEVNAEKNANYTVEQWVNFYRQILKDAGCEKPIWVTGFGFSPTQYEDQAAVSTTEQSNFAIKELVMLLGSDVKRVSYSNIAGFALPDEAVTTWNNLAHSLVGAKFENLTMSGENYCPIATSCFNPEANYKAAGSSVFGLPKAPTEMQKSRTYSFVKDDGSRVFVSWTTGDVGVNIIQSPFSDISPTNAHLAAILGLTKLGIIAGYANGTFGADLQINRAEFLKILVGATKDKNLAISGTNCFPDVGSEWFAPYICYAKSRGWVGGYSDGKFRPANPINRAEALKILVSAFGWPVTATSGAWYTPFVNAALAKDVLRTGEAKDYDKAENRGFIAELVWRALGN